MSNDGEEEKKEENEKNRFLSFAECKCFASDQDQFFHFDFVQLSFISCLRKKFHFMIEIIFSSFTNNKKRDREKEKDLFMPLKCD